ncbi:MAG TPA: oxygenase MpaB family protein [Jiangellaceae bacterium]|nr:oxygenase MpaB family protein [Jiangellaceae bacterium]
MPVLDAVRSRLNRELFARVAGENGPAARERIHGTPGPRWFAPGSPIRRVHGDVSMYVGGLRALLLQSLHPLAMAAVAGHSGFRGDPWGRLARTSTFLAETTFGTVEHAEQAVAKVRGVHQRVRGHAPDRRPYHASDPHLLTWVHIAEIDSFLRAHQRYGRSPLGPAESDEYVAQTAQVARRLGAVQVPETTAELAEIVEAYRPELASTAAARETTRFLLLQPPVPWVARAPYTLLAGAAVGLLPGWAHRMLQVPYLPPVEATVGRAGGHAVTSGLRWITAG